MKRIRKDKKQGVLLFEVTEKPLEIKIKSKSANPDYIYHKYCFYEKRNAICQVISEDDSSLRLHLWVDDYLVRLKVPRNKVIRLPLAKDYFVVKLYDYLFQRKLKAVESQADTKHQTLWEINCFMHIIEAELKIV